MTRLHLSGLSILTGLLLALGWPAIGDFSPLLFLAFIPLLFVEHNVSLSSSSFRWYPLLTFITFNVLTTYFVYCVSEDFATKLFVVLAAVAVNSLVMTLVFTLFRYTKRHLGDRRGYIALVVYWMAFEYFHLNWELTWPWLSLGNGFANQVTWIQWYEYTGVFGGTLWILVVNVLIFKILKRSVFDGVTFSQNRPALIGVACLLIAPIVISKIMYSTYDEIQKPVKVVILQPNVDPYNEKYESSGTVQLNKMLKLLDNMSDDVDYIVAPETALSGDIQENILDETPVVVLIREFLLRYPTTEFVSGMSSWRLLENDNLTSTARKFQNHDAYYDSYNAAIQVNLKEASQVYHKSKLVQGVEKMPFASLLKPLEQFALDMGGTTGTLGSQDEASVFTSKIKDLKIAPVICYESIYGEYVASYVLKGASLIFIMTNDGWWEDTPGYKQHLAYARIRAIENRRSIARSANTGVSCFINQRGDVSKETEWWKEDAIEGSLNANDELTFYTKMGNYLARISSFVAVALLIFAFVNSKRGNAGSN
ncbi:MAG: apolipoprotein N-acyltransferase, partial [Flavobacteriales bacterium]|nr:apolipoprotein N-acyltransferase [Flavobacteriales bacterium]